MCWKYEDKCRGGCTDVVLGVNGGYEWNNTISLIEWFQAELGMKPKLPSSEFFEITYKYFTELHDKGLLQEMTEEEYQAAVEKFYKYWRIE